MDTNTLLTLIKAWTDILVPAGGLITAILTVRKYFDDRFNQREQRKLTLGQQSRDLQWRRIEFLANASRELDGDPRAQPFMRFCDSLQPVEDSELNIALTGEASSSALSSQTEFSESLEFVLKFFTRLQMAVETKAITLSEARMYNWYFTKILQVDQIRQFCIDHGYSDILILAQDVLLEAFKNSPDFDELPCWDSVIRKAAMQKRFQNNVHQK